MDYSQHLDMDSWEDGFISAARFALENKRLFYHIYNSVSRERVERYLYSIAGKRKNKTTKRPFRRVKRPSGFWNARASAPPYNPCWTRN